jgi:hypothetical protein
MEINKVEVVALQEATEKANKDVTELCELELSLVGGGCGEVLFG